MDETSYLDNLATGHSLDLSETEEWLSMVVLECNSTGMHHSCNISEGYGGDAINESSCELSRPTPRLGLRGRSTQGISTLELTG